MKKTGLYLICGNCPDKCSEDWIASLKEIQPDKTKIIPGAETEVVEKANLHCINKCRNRFLFIIKKKCPICGSDDILDCPPEAWYIYKCNNCNETLNSHKKL